MSTFAQRSAAWIDALPLRDRGMLFGMALMALGGLWYLTLMQPVEVRRGALLNEVPELQRQIKTLNASLTAGLAARTHDPDIDNRKAYRALESELAGMDAKLKALTSVLVPPKFMAQALKDVLSSQDGTHIVSVEGLGARPLVAMTQGTASAQPDEPQAPPPPATGIYKHGLALAFDARYLDTLAYLKTLEALPWRFLWDSVQLEVLEYPRAQVTITVHSLSLDNDWIGV